MGMEAHSNLELNTGINCSPKASYFEHTYNDEQYTEPYHLLHIWYKEENGSEAITINQADAKLEVEKWLPFFVRIFLITLFFIKL